MRSAGMPDSRATIDSASSAVSRCCASKSAGTYSASITGVIGITLSRCTVPLQVCARVAAVARAGLARSVSARSIGTRIELNIEGPPLCPQVLRAGAAGVSIGALLEELRRDEHHQIAAGEAHVAPIIGVEIEHGEPRCRHVAHQLVPRVGIAVAGQSNREFVHAGVVADEQELLRIECR